MVYILNDKSFIPSVASDSAVTVIDFFAEWCAPCKVLGKSLEVLQSKYPGIKIYKVDVDALDIESVVIGGVKVTISSLPTVVITKSGTIVDVVMGANIPKIETAITKVM